MAGAPGVEEFKLFGWICSAAKRQQYFGYRYEPANATSLRRPGAQ